MKRGLFIGRFQPFHDGHLSVLKKMHTLGYNEVIVGIGSSQYSRTKKNPLSVNERIEIIKLVTSKHDDIPVIKLVEIPDIHNDDEWVDHVNKIVHSAVGDYESIFTGNNWTARLFNDKNYNVNQVNQSIDISGSKIREQIITNNDNWKKFVDPEIIDKLKNAVRESTT
ncbi:MAG: adenylyltransferase/cytidyltransferase family protein [bacterium]|nr:adenylyltransferase/cytidyltransferase family protein [bacterium]